MYAICYIYKSCIGCSAYSEKSLYGGLVFRNEEPVSCVGKNGPAIDNKPENVSGV